MSTEYAIEARMVEGIIHQSDWQPLTDEELAGVDEMLSQLTDLAHIRLTVGEFRIYLNPKQAITVTLLKREFSDG